MTMSTKASGQTIHIRLFLIFYCLLLVSSCANKESAGNFSSELDKILWTSNENTQPVPPGTNFETFNIFIMDVDGSNRNQLTNDIWPVVNQHPVFTPDNQRIVWLRGDELWTMKLDGSDKQQLTDPPSQEADGHPWAATDGFVYFTRVKLSNQPPFDSHRILRIKLDGTAESEIIGSTNLDRFHPNLHPDENQIIYTAGPAGSGVGTQIRVYNLNTGEDKVVLGPGAFSAAIIHPGGDKMVLARNPDGDENFEIAEYKFPSGDFIGQIVGDNLNNTIPYYDYPAGARVLWTGQPDRALQSRRTRHLWLKASDPRPLTSGPFENTHIVGLITIDPQSNRCIPRPVGCYPTPPPCQQFLLPLDISDNAEILGKTAAQADRTSGNLQQVKADEYSDFMQLSLVLYVKGEAGNSTPENREKAMLLSQYLTQNGNEVVRERVADFYVNGYLAEAEME